MRLTDLAQSPAFQQWWAQGRALTVGDGEGSTLTLTTALADSLTDEIRTTFAGQNVHPETLLRAVQLRLKMADKMANSVRMPKADYGHPEPKETPEVPTITPDARPRPARKPRK